MRYFLINISIFLVVLSCQDRKNTSVKRETESKLYSTTEDDKEMNQAINEAKQKLNEFEKNLVSNNFDTSTFALKLRFPTETGDEHIWATSIRLVAGEYYGIIDNVPKLTTQVKLGQRVKLNRDSITDWMYAENGVLRGGFTIRVIRRRMNDQEKRQFDSSFRLRIEDP